MRLIIAAVIVGLIAGALGWLSFEGCTLISCTI